MRELGRLPFLPRQTCRNSTCKYGCVLIDDREEREGRGGRRDGVLLEYVWSGTHARKHNSLDKNEEIFNAGQESAHERERESERVREE